MKHSKKAFSLLISLTLILLLSTLVMFILNSTALSQKAYVNIYLREGAQLFLRSSKELIYTAINESAQDLDTITIISSDKRYIAKARRDTNTSFIIDVSLNKAYEKNSAYTLQLTQKMEIK